MRVDPAKEKQTRQLNGLLAGDILQGIMEKRNYYAVCTVLPIAAACIDKSHGLVERRNFNGINELCTKLVNKVLFDQGGGAWVARERERLRSEI